MACLPTCADADHPPRYAPILAGEHMLAKLERRETRPARLSVDYLDRLAAWAATTPLDALPPAVRERACLVIADSLGVTVHGMQVPEMRAFVARHLADARPGRASVIGAGRRADPASAALLNGTAGTWIDMNEGNLHAERSSRASRSSRSRGPSPSRTAGRGATCSPPSSSATR